MSNKQIAALMAVRAFAGTNTVSADNNFADGVAAANRHVINHIDYLITQVQAGHEVPFVVEHESRFPFQGKVTSEPQLADRHALQAEGKHPAPCARFCEANAFQIEIRQLSAQLEQAEHQRVPNAKAVAECLAVLRPMAKGKFPQEQALEELAGYLAAAPEAPAQEGGAA